MEGKERYVIRYDLDYNRCLIDTEENKGVGDCTRIVYLLNQQDKRIKELEQENRELHTAINLSIPNQIAMKDEIERLHTCVDNRIDELEKENQQLKQQLHELPKKIVGEIRKEIEFPLYVHPDFDEFECVFDIDKLLDTILKKYGEKDE